MVGLTGISLTSASVTLIAKSDNTTTLSGVSSTSAIGTLTPADQVMGLTGLSLTSAIGGIVLDQQTISLTGQQSISAVGDIIIGIVLTGGIGLVAFVKKKLNKIDR